MRTALTIAGSDSGGGAGIQADLKTFAALGVFGTSAITAVTAQNTLGVTGYVELAPEFVASQIDAVLSDIGADAVKTGMVASRPIIEAIADRLEAHGRPPLVVDPVMVAASGDPLLARDAEEALARVLFPLAQVVTPNLPEAQVLTGQEITGLPAMREAARRLHDLGCRYVLVKGGHLPGDPVDLLYDGRDFLEFAAARIVTRSSHGTGCTYAAAIAAGLAHGLAVPQAVARAKNYLTEAIRRAPALGRGNGPVHHFHRLYPAAGLEPPATRPDLRVYVLAGQAAGADPVRAVEAALDGGATCVQLREKDAATARLVELGKALRDLTRRRGVALVVNDRLDVALAVEADGVHVGDEDMPLAEARRLLGPGRILGVSAATPEEARRAQAAGADYLGVGPVFATGSKADAGPPIGPEGLAAVAAAVDIPVVGIGGIDAARAGGVVAAGAAGVAVISAVFGEEDPAAAARVLRQAVDEALPGPRAPL